MSIKIMAEVWDHADASGGELLFLLALADQANDEDRCAWPGGKVLQQRARCSRRSVYYHAERLQEQGIITALEEGERPERYSRKAGRETTCWRINPVDEWRGATSAPVQVLHEEGCNELHPRGATSCTRTSTNHQGENPKNPSRALRRDVTASKRTTRKARPEVDTGDGLESLGGGERKVVEEPTAPANLRLLKPVHGWTTKTLAVSFTRRALAADTVPASARDTQEGALGKTFRKWFDNGTATPDDVAKAMDLFFVAPATRLHGEASLWLAFINHYATLAQQVGKTSMHDTDYYPEPSVKHSLAGRKR